ncbi:oxidoreductase [Ectothiorhodospira shaposhnikovii]|uniref:complex I subunit 5 family protein n=1 Tax=Ectothiorhodospira shaposhnikovii TaxID=1054 RepID=UPI001F5B5131|nr:proton-conducting transporter membrane subunit [Ectothiorhodospira shaposhnikovii]MBK1672014.1 oxidoreductase [Ectothiorhodospira shaposhnikovii]
MPWMDVMADMALAPWLVILPLAGALLAGLWPAAARWWGLLTALLTLVMALLLALQVHAHGPMILDLGGWAPPLGITLVADGLASLMLLMTAVVGLAISLHALGYLAGEGRGHWFWILWLWLWAAMNALYLSGDVFNLYVTLELVVLASVALVALAGGAAPLVAAMRYLLVSLLGSMAYLMGVALLYGAYGVLGLQALGAQVALSAAPMLAAVLMTVGLLAKSALFPLHVWLPPAHGSAPAPVSAALSALVVKVSFYLILRLWLTVFPALPLSGLDVLMGVLAAGAVLWGGLMALRAPRLKQVVAYSTVAQVGYLFLLFPFLRAHPEGWKAVVFFAVAHGVAKAAVFLAAGTLQRAAGHDRLADLGAVMRGRLKTSFALGIAGAGLVGLPFTGGFIAKWLLVQTALEAGLWIWALVVLGGGLLAGAYVFRLLGPAFEPGPADRGRPLPAVMEWVPLALALLTIGLGFAGTPALSLLARTLAGGGG